MMQLIVLALILPCIFAVPISRSFHELPCLIDRNCRPFFLFYFLDGTCNLRGDPYGQITNSSCSYSLNWAVFMLLFMLPLLFCPISMVVGMVIARFKQRTKETSLETAADPTLQERVARLTSYFKTVKEDANKQRVFLRRPISDPIIQANHPVYVMDKPRGESPSGWSAQETTPAAEESTLAIVEHQPQRAMGNTLPAPELYRKRNRTYRLMVFFDSTKTPTHPESDVDSSLTVEFPLYYAANSTVTDEANLTQDEWIFILSQKQKIKFIWRRAIWKPDT